MNEPDQEEPPRQFPPEGEQVQKERQWVLHELEKITQPYVKHEMESQ